MAYYIIKTRLSDYVLDIEGDGGSGSRVVTWERHGKDNQVWYDDIASGTIRSKGNKCCLTIENDKLIVKKLEPGNAAQQWMRVGPTIRNRVEPEKVLDVYKKSKELQAEVGWYRYKGGDNQLWDFEFTKGTASGVPSPYYQGQKREFFIVSSMNGKVLDIAGEKMEPATKIVMYEKHDDPKPNQLWYLDHMGLLRSSLNDLAPTNQGKGDKLETGMPTADPRCQWMIQGEKIINRVGEVMDIAGESKSNGASVVSYDDKDQSNQKWRLLYI